jgi:hypothetical protein
MKRPGLVLPALVFLFLAGLAPALAGWLTNGRCSQVRPAPTPSAPSGDTLHSEAMQRWRSGQWHHWRACLLQP